MIKCNYNFNTWNLQTNVPSKYKTKEVFKFFIYFVINVISIIFIITSNCKSFIIKLIIVVVNFKNKN